MKSSGLAILLAAGLAAPVWAEPVARIRDVEDESLRSQLRAVIGETPHAPAGPREARQRAEEAAARVRRALRSFGYYAGTATAVVLDGDGRLRPAVRVEPGPRFTFSSVDLDLTRPVTQPAAERTRAAFTLSEGDPVDAQSILAAEHEAVVTLRAEGYPDAETRERDIVVDHAATTARGQFIIEPGPFARFGAIEMPGETILRPSYVRRLAPFVPGDPAAPEALIDFADRLSGLPGVERAEVRLGDTVDGEEARTVIVELEAAPRHQLELGAGYSTTEGAGIEGEWARRNLFGGAEALTLTARLATLDSLAGARLEFPNWQRYGQTLTLTAEAEAERTDAYDREAFTLGAGLRRAISDELAATLGAEIETARVEEARGVTRTRAGDLQLAAASIGAIWDRRDDPLDPQTGFTLEGDFVPAAVFDDGFTTFYTARIAATAYYPLAEDVVLAGRARLGTILNVDAAEIPADRRFYAGGGGSARGFEYQSLSPAGPTGQPFGGTSLVETSVEVRWRRSDTLGFAAFIDSAAAGSDPMPDISAMRAAFGIGVRYYTGFGPIRLDLATPLDRRDGEDPVSIYISIGQAF
ncbi:MULTISPECIES: autotransporter assembly complex protein TamA [Hyphobacterium]|uniref:Autotransporter assembly complex family protein n=1 Tax=Hyphobacterium vulgare TaxID=1736751 RepID=A0ABV6ZWD4_9PROT